MRPISVYYSIFVAFAHTDAAVLRVRESTAAPNKLGPAPFETMGKITKQRYKEEEKLDFDMDDWDGYGGIKKGSDLFRCHVTCGTLIQILGRTCQHELAQDFVDYCLGDCKREYPDTVYPSIKRARECKLKPREKAKPTQPDTESSSKPTLVSLPASTAHVSDEASSPSGSATAALRPQTTPSIPVADEPSATMEPEVTLHTLDTTATASAFPTHSHPIDDSPDSSRHTSEVQELDGGDAATSNVNLTNGSVMRVVNFLVAGAAALTSLILTVVV